MQYEMPWHRAVCTPGAFSTASVRMGKSPQLLSNWLSATDQFADWIEQPYASDTGLLKALCQAQVSLMASR